MTGIDTGPGSLGPIACVTVTAPDLDQVEACYGSYLDYVVAGRGHIPQKLATAWQSPGVADQRYLLLRPAAGDDFIFRFIESPAKDQLVPFSTYGWNAAEIMVKNVDAMAERLAGSPFEIIGPPANLSFTDDIRAMQILGPGGELLYLTEFKKPIPAFDTPIARCDVDMVFIVILGGPSMNDLQGFFADNYGIPRAAVVDSRVKGMSAAFGNSPEHKYPIAALPLRGQALIEVDEMPPEATARPAADGQLPPGIAMVSFVTRGITNDTGANPALDEPPYRQARSVSCRRGAAGELIELIHLD
jgi:hypothetical protein